jgi:hypothetical protein
MDGPDNAPKLRQAVQRGARARTLWQDELLQEAFARAEADIVEAWKASGAHGAEARQMAWWHYRALQDVKQQIKGLIFAGDAAAQELSRWDQAKQALGRLIA